MALTDERVDVAPDRWPWALALGALAAGLLTLLGTLLLGGGSPQPSPAGLPDAGPVTGWALPAVRFLADAASLIAAGTALTAAVLLPYVPGTAGRLDRYGLRSSRTAAVAAGVVAVAAAVEMVLTYSDFIGVPLGTALSTPGVSSFVVDTVQGRALLVQVLLFGAAVFGAASLRTTRGAGILAVVCFWGVAAPALAGHAGNSPNHMLAVSSLVVHVLAVAAWLGGLAGVGLLARQDGLDLREAAGRFSALALWCVVAVGASGLVNAWVRLGAIREILGSAYGLLALGKLAGLLVLGTLGYVHRRRTLPALATSRRPFLRLAAGEVVVMAAVVGLAVGLSRTPTPVPVDGGSETVAESILGYPMPAAPDVFRLVFAGHLDGFWFAFVVLAGALYASGLRRLAAAGVRWPRGRTVAWYAGLAALLFLTCGGVGTYASVLFSAHMVQHMALNMIVPTLLVLGGPLTLALRTLPARREGGLRRTLLAVLHSRVVRFLTHPLVAAGQFVAGLYVVYFTSLYDTLMAGHWGHLAMQVHFVASGALFFWVLVGVDPAPRRVPYPLRALLLLATMAAHAFFSIALMSTSAIIGRLYYTQLAVPWVGSLVADQRVGGGISWAFGEIPIVLVLGAMFVQWVKADRREAAAYDRAADRAEAEAEAAEAAAARSEPSGS